MPAKKASRTKTKQASRTKAKKGLKLRPPKLPQILQGVGAEEWPPPQDCGDFFEQEGVASMRVESCDSELPPNLVRQLAKAAQRDAQEKANFRCPTRCPAALFQWKKNELPVCRNNVATLTVVGSFHCK